MPFSTIKAFKKVKSGGFFSKLFSDPEQKYEESCDLFKQAALNYKLAKRCFFFI